MNNLLKYHNFLKNGSYCATLQSLVFACFVITLCVGCRSSMQKKEGGSDPALTRISDRASELYNLGGIEGAQEEYFKVLKQAWASDDAYESGTAAYHLAACYFSVGDAEKAKDWLIDSRYELNRCGASCRNVWLLEAKIARVEKRYDDVAYLLQRSTSENTSDTSLRIFDGDGDRVLPRIQLASVRTPLGGVRGKLLQKQEDAAEDLPVLLMKAAVAVEKNAVSEAKRHLKEAEQKLSFVEQPEWQAEWYRVSGDLAFRTGQAKLAAEFYDQEADALSSAGLYRDLPKVLTQSANSYESVKQFAVAADRLCRAARLYFGRSEYELAWQTVQAAGNLSEMSEDATIQVRLRLLAEQIINELPQD